MSPENHQIASENAVFSTSRIHGRKLAIAGKCVCRDTRPLQKMPKGTTDVLTRGNLTGVRGWLARLENVVFRSQTASIRHSL